MNSELTQAIERVEQAVRDLATSVHAGDRLEELAADCASQIRSRHDSFVAIGNAMREGRVTPADASASIIQTGSWCPDLDKVQRWRRDAFEIREANGARMAQLRDAVAKLRDMDASRVDREDAPL